MKTQFSQAATLLFLLLAMAAASPAFAQTGRIYTAPDPAATGAITGRVSAELTHAVAVEHDRVRVYLGNLTDGGRAFRFDHLPVGKYDLVLFEKSGVVYEGLALGAAPVLSETSSGNLEKRIALADSFFDRAHIHRTGVSTDGETLLVLVERYRSHDVLKQSGEALGQMLRRFEVVELARAEDDWQVSASRHLYREGEPIPFDPQFLKDVNIPPLGDLRLINSLKDLGQIDLPKP